MIEIKNDIIKKYKYNDYVIYVKETNDSYECYLQNENYGIISMIYGITKEQDTLEELLTIVADNIYYDIARYKEDIEDKD